LRRECVGQRFDSLGSAPRAQAMVVLGSWRAWARPQRTKRQPASHLRLRCPIRSNPQRCRRLRRALVVSGAI